MSHRTSRFLLVLLFVALPVSAWAQEPESPPIGETPASEEPAVTTDETPAVTTDETPATTDETPVVTTDKAPLIATDQAPAVTTDENSQPATNPEGERYPLPVHMSPHKPAVLAPPAEERRWDYGGDESWIINYRLPRDVFELQLSAGVSRGFDEVPVHAEKTGGMEYGPVLSLQVAWRLDYIFSPYLDVGWAHLVTTETTATTDAGDELKTEATLSAHHIMGGILFDIWYFRARFGAGFNHMMMSAIVDGDEVSTADWDFGYALGLGGVFWRDHGFQVGLEARGFLDPALETGYVSLGLFGTYDLFSF